MTRPRFEAVLERGPGGGACVSLPAEVVAALGGGRLRVVGTINGVPFRSSTMTTAGGGALLGVHKATREMAGAAFGDPVSVEVEVDDSVRKVEIPPELERSFAAEPALRAAFDSLSFTRRREYAAGIAEASRPGTRSRRLARTLDELRSRPGG